MTLNLAYTHVMSVSMSVSVILYEGQKVLDREKDDDM